MGRGFFVNVSTPELKNVLKDFQNYDDVTQNKIRGVVRTGTQQVLQGTLRRMQKRTGHMASKTTMDFDAEKCIGTVRVKSPVAHLVEFGHAGPTPESKRTPEHPSLRPSYEEVKPGIVSGLESAVKP